MIDWLRRPVEPTIELAGEAYPLVIRRNPRARRIILRLTPDGRGVQVTLPPWGRTIDALSFARRRSDWLTNQLARQPRPVCPLANGICYRGVHHRVELRPNERRKVAIVDRTIIVGGPEDTAKARLSRWLEAECLRLSEPDLAHYCRQAGRPVPRLALSRAQRRWGSCSAKGTVRINWRLVMAPDHVRRSVIAHEVAHLVHFDHSPAFHALLASLFEDGAEKGLKPTYGGLNAAEAWLKASGRTLFQPFG